MNTDAAAGLIERPSVARLLAVLDADGEEARIVGGAIRNALLDRPVNEIDIATTAPPDVVMARAAKARWRCIPTGIAHGTVTLHVGGEAFEVTTLREDVETDGRHATVRFGRDFAADARRRDFTINALSMGRDGRLHDYTQGVQDLAARKVRFIGDARARVREDFLRILRFFRFSADYGEEPLDASGVEACFAERDGLLRLSAERVRAELFKLLTARRAATVVRRIVDEGLFDALLRLRPDPERLGRLIENEGAAADALLRLAALYLGDGSAAELLRERLRLSNAEYDRLRRAAAAATLLAADGAPPREASLRTTLMIEGREAATDALALIRAGDDRASLDGWMAAAAFLRDTEAPKLPFSGHDLKARGMTDGRAIGAALKDLQARWISAGFPKDPRRLAQLLDEATRPPV